MELNYCFLFIPGEYPYAKCFICGEEGHLSSKCSENPRGLYPEGKITKLEPTLFLKAHPNKKGISEVVTA